ncbi:hypothetical protein BX070DRAFT_235660 [Coemansia spiralis]|nr:hypothetical protein BX070DRAFT_235660 [Coemansia spiralis]
MPAASLLSSEDKAAIKAAQPSSTHKILAAAIARLFAAQPGKTNWTYTHKLGGLILVKDASRNRPSFLRIVNLSGSGPSILWEQELYEGFEFIEQKPFFFALFGDDYIFGLDFVDEREAATFASKVSRRIAKVSGKRGDQAAAGSASLQTSAAPPASAPAAARLNGNALKGGGPTATQKILNLDDEKYSKLVKALAAFNITEGMLDDPDTAKFIKNPGSSTSTSHKCATVSPAAAASTSETQCTATTTTKTQNTSIKAQPTTNSATATAASVDATCSPGNGINTAATAASTKTAPKSPAMPSHHVPPPPPRRSENTPSPVHRSSEEQQQFAAPAPPPMAPPMAPPAPPPQPPAKSPMAPPLPPPMAPPAPPPMAPPTPPSMGPPTQQTETPPPPPLPSVGGDGRGALLASIRGAGGIGGLRKTDASASNRASISSTTQHPKSPGDTSPGAKSGGNLADALASALAQRNRAIAGDSDSEDEGDDDW